MFVMTALVVNTLVSMRIQANSLMTLMLFEVSAMNPSSKRGESKEESEREEDSAGLPNSTESGDGEGELLRLEKVGVRRIGGGE